MARKGRRQISRQTEQVQAQLREMQEFERLSDEEQIKRYRQQDDQLKAKNEELKLLNNKLKQAEQDVLECNQRFDLAVAAKPDDNIKPMRLSKDKKGKHGTAILSLNDWHCEERVDPEKVNGFNEYNLGIADKRIKRTIEKFLVLLDMTRHATRVDDLLVWLGGDLITGYIHEELQETNFLSPSQAILWVEERVISLLRELKRQADVKHIRVVANHGNHGRTNPRKRIKTGAENSFEWLAYNHIANVFAGDPMFSFNIARGEVLYETVQKHVVRFSHGDAVRYEGGVGGITIPILKRIAQWDKTKRADLDMFGHWHQFLHHWKFVACGAMIGYNDFTVHIGGDYQPPTQTFSVIDQNLGVVDARPIFCEPAAKFRQESTA